MHTFQKVFVVAGGTLLILFLLLGALLPPGGVRTSLDLVAPCGTIVATTIASRLIDPTIAAAAFFQPVIFSFFSRFGIRACAFSRPTTVNDAPASGHRISSSGCEPLTGLTGAADWSMLLFLLLVRARVDAFAFALG